MSLALSVPAALLSSSYTEETQMSFWKSVKNYMVYGTAKRGESESEIVYTIYNGERHINPVHVTMQVLLEAELLLSDYLNIDLAPYGVPKETEVTITGVADFLMNHYETDLIGGKEVVRLGYHFDYPIYDLKAPWYSGMAQGHATIVLLAAYLITNDEAYLDFAKKVVAILGIQTTSGGAMIPLDDGTVWFEEYADPLKDISESPRVLNGHVFAVDGLFFYWMITKDTGVRTLLEKGILGVDRNIHRYDAGFWSYYGLKGNFAHIGYHKLHVKQLSRLKYYADYLRISDYRKLQKYSKVFVDNLDLAPLGYIQRMMFQRNNLVYIIFSTNFMFWFFVFVVALGFLGARNASLKS